MKKVDIVEKVIEHHFNTFPCNEDVWENGTLDELILGVLRQPFCTYVNKDGRFGVKFDVEAYEKTLNEMDDEELVKSCSDMVSEAFKNYASERGIEIDGATAGYVNSFSLALRIALKGGHVVY